MSGSFSFNGIRKDYIFIRMGFNRPAFAPIERDIMKVTGLAGGHLVRTNTEVRTLEVPVILKADDQADLQKRKEDLAEWLIHDDPKELIFDDETDRTYMAVIDDEADLDELVFRGRGKITFVCSMPYKLGNEQVKELAIENDSLRAKFKNKGTVESLPTIDITVGAKSPFLDVWNGDDYFRLGYPVGIKNKTVDTEERLMWEQFDNLNGWASHTGKLGIFETTGTIATKSGYAYPTNMGSGSDWHGCFATKDIPTSPTGAIADFKFDAQMTLKASHWNQLGKTIVMALDANDEVICQVDMSDSYIGSEYTISHASIGSAEFKPVPPAYTLAEEHGGAYGIFNQFHGHFAIRRQGNMWRVYCAKYTPGTEIDGASYVKTWYDTDSSNPLTKREPKKIAIGFVSYGTYPAINDLRISDLKFWKLHKLNVDETPYIFDIGDKIQIDTEHSLVSINGSNAVALKDMFSRFPKVKRGDNDIIVRPSNVGIAKLTYRERYL
ncbi:distal tail protein Dit [Bacillus thuringiensis]|uniref:Phage tail family protein n=1 Tax=Bacillus thuringiensis serovar andalousiensis TaxID=257985 RepID=A0A6H0TNV0_BACTU|nr:distal tail protein Dit [Bacillus thuringiensis]QIW21334.1 phage tail family protein [Bacillus thuringiensis serovar andalousiensis]